MSLPVILAESCRPPSTVYGSIVAMSVEGGFMSSSEMAAKCWRSVWPVLSCELHLQVTHVGLSKPSPR